MMSATLAHAFADMSIGYISALDSFKDPSDVSLHAAVELKQLCAGYNSPIKLAFVHPNDLMSPDKQCFT